MTSCEINQMLAKMGRAGWIIFPESEDELMLKIQRINARIREFVKSGEIGQKHADTTPKTARPGSWSERESISENNR